MAWWPFRKHPQPKRLSDLAVAQTVRQPAVAVRRAAGKYDAAQTTDNNERHWAAADALSADAANSYAVRKRVRERCRLEMANSPWLNGIIGTYAFDVVGQHGPRLQFDSGDEGLNDAIEREWGIYAAKMGLGRKLRTLHRARTVDGEAFGLFISNPGLDYPVQADLRLLECDRVRSDQVISRENDIDGVLIDAAGNAVSYRMLDKHPGGTIFAPLERATTYEAEWIVHWFAEFRPEQHRGISELMSALPYCATLRRFILATLDSAESAANVSGWIHTYATPDDGATEIAPMDTIETERNTWVTLPEGWDAKQMDAKHPNASFEMFIRLILNAIARPIAMPLNIAMCDSSGSNFSSGRLDHGVYYRAVRILQGDMGEQVVERLFARWLREAQLVFNWVTLEKTDHTWLWQQREAIDPRDSRAETDGLASGRQTHPGIYASRGLDWRAEFRKEAEALGIALEEYQELVRRKLFGSAGAGADDQGQADTTADAVAERVEEMIRNAR